MAVAKHRTDSVEGLTVVLRGLMAAVRRGEAELPVLDPAVADLGRLCGDPDADLEEVVRAAGRDPAITTGILRAASSWSMSRSKPASTLREACVRLGNRRVLGIAFGVVVQSTLSCRRRPYASILDRYWRHHFYAADVAAQLANELSDVPAEEMHLVALLHNIGEPLMLHYLAGSDVDDSAPGFIGHLNTVVRTYHEAFGGHLAREWGLPVMVQELASRHHQPLPQGPLQGLHKIRAVLMASRDLAFEKGLVYLEGQTGHSARWLNLLGVDAESVSGPSHVDGSVGVRSRAQRVRSEGSGRYSPKRMAHVAAR